MIRALQTVGWGLLAPDPVYLEDGVVALLGRNGSGKSSALDAMKSVCGARRFGQGRSASSYRFAGRAGAPAARTAYVLCVMSNQRPDGTRRLDGYGDELTVIMEAGPAQRRFLVCDGRHLLPVGDGLAGAVAALRAEHARADWLRPAEYERRVLTGLGFGPAVRRLLEIPQGDVQKALDRDPKALVGLLVELAGGRDAAAAFARAHAAVEEARDAHAEARRRVDRSRAELAERRLRLDADARALRLRERLSSLHAPLSAALDTLTAQQGSRRDWEARRERSPRPQPAAPVAPRRAVTPPEPAQGDRVSVVDFDALRERGVRVVSRDGVWCVHPEDRARASALLAPGQALLVAVDGLRLTLGSDALVHGPRLRRLDDTSEPRPRPAPAEPPAARPAAPDLPEPPPVDERLLTRLRAAVRALTDAQLPRAAPGAELPAEAEALLGMYQAFTSDGIPPAPRSRDSEGELAAAESMLEAETSELDVRAGTLEEARGQLTAARGAYEQAVQRALSGAADRFAGICRDAGLDGRMSVGEGPDGPQVMISAAESPGEELRPLWGSQASLSGGWRATVVVLALLACLDAEQALPALLLDEVGASLDETRLGALGQAFARLAERRGLQTLMTLPTNALSDVVASFAAQQVGYLRPLAGEPLAPPPHVVSLTDRTLRAA